MASTTRLPSQRDKMVYRIFTDQHGRRFGAQADVRNQRPIGDLTPLGGYDPPWLPPMRYMKWAMEGGLDFAWDYDTIAQEWAEGGSAYYSDATKFALEHNLPVPQPGGEIDRRIRDVFKDPPQSPAIPLAAKAGDPWILGKPGAKRNDELYGLLHHGQQQSAAEFLTAITNRILPTITDPVLPPPSKAEGEGEVTWKEFRTAMLKRGKTLKEAGEAWKEVQAALAEEAAV